MKQWFLRILVILAVVAVFVEVVSYLVDDPLRRYVERQMNSRLKGYSVQITKLTTHPFVLSVDVKSVSVRQKEHPDPPVAELGRMRAGLSWLDLFTGHLAGSAQIDEPRLYINIENLAAEIKKPPAKKEAWQDTLEALFPVTMNELQIENGEITYRETAQFKPLKISKITFIAHNIKNVRSRAGVFPSPVFLQADLFGSGKLRVDGDADFLLKPVMGMKATFELAGLDLSAFRQMAKLSSLRIAKGTLTATGGFEYSPQTKRLDMKSLTIRDPEIDYIYLAQPEKEKPPEKKTPFTITAETVRITKGNLGVVNKTSNPSYRVFVGDLDLEVKNFSNRFSQGPADVSVTGKFMGTGETTASGTFRPETKGPDFHMRIAIRNTQMKDMNNLFRAYGNFDVSRGLFSFYCELTVKNDKVAGYVKPLFRDMKVYDKRKDKEKSEFRKLYEKIVGGVAKLLENPRKTVATETPVTGKLPAAHVSTWNAIVNIFQNAFFHSILPGFEKNIP